VLVRPDQHIAWHGSTVEDPAALLQHVVGGIDGPNVVDPNPSHLEEIAR